MKRFSQSPLVFFAGAILSSLFLTSCTEHQKYPPEWSALVSMEDNRCPDLSGIYMITGEEMDKTPAYEPPPKTNWTGLQTTNSDTKNCPLNLFDVFSTVPSMSGGVYATYAQISRPDDDALEVSFMNDQGLVGKRIYSKKKKEYICSSKGITFSGDEFGTRGVLRGPHYSIDILGQPWTFPWGEGSWGKYYVARSVDGCLIVKRRTTAVIVFYGAPIWRSEETWHRFHQLNVP